MTTKTDKTIENTLNNLAKDLTNDLPMDDLANALDIINKEHVINEQPAFEPKKFLVPANEEIKELKNQLANQEEKTDLELEEISNQADQAFYDLMDIVLTAGTATKGVSDTASAAQAFLQIKLNSKLAKEELKLKKERQKLEKLKFERYNNPDTSDNIDDDDVIIVK